MAVAVRDERPSRPPEPATDQGLSDELWDLIQLCWSPEPHKRPSAGQVLICLQDVYRQHTDSSILGKGGECAPPSPMDVLWRENRNALAFPENFISVLALLERGRRWHNGVLCESVKNFRIPPQECELERETRTLVKYINYYQSDDSLNSLNSPVNDSDDSFNSDSFDNNLNDNDFTLV